MLFRACGLGWQMGLGPVTRVVHKFRGLVIQISGLLSHGHWGRSKAEDFQKARTLKPDKLDS